MHLLAISLLTILAGTLLLAKFRKDMPGKFFAFVSWFFIVVGFILFVGFIAGGICKLKHHGFACHHNCQHEMMMKDCNHGMQGGVCCPEGMDKAMCCKMQGMDKAMCCKMQGMDKAMCCKMQGCMPHDSMMKCCPKHMGGDSTKMQVPKK